MYRILVPVDRDQARADTVVETLTRLPFDTSAVEIVVLSVFEEMKGVDDIGGGVDTEELFEDVDLPESVPTVMDALENAGFSVTLRREHGEPGDVILDVAQENNVDHVVMSGRRRSPVGKTIFGSTTQSVILGIDKPVTVTMPHD